MSMRYLMIEVGREAYSPADLKGRTLTVGSLIRELQGYDENLPIVVSHDNSFTYGGIRANNIIDSETDEDEDEEVEE